MTKSKAVALDFDNCILLDETTRKGSEEIKDQAWSEVFSECGWVVLHLLLEEAKAEIAGGRGDRQDIAKKILRQLSWPEGTLAAEAHRRCELFNQLVQRGISQTSIPERTRMILTDLAARLPLYVNTATPIAAAMESLTVLGIDHLFAGIYGRPGTKAANLLQIVRRESIEPMELLFVDDQPSGWQAAQEVGCHFVGIHTAKNQAWHTGQQPFRVIQSLGEIIQITCP